MLANSSIVTMVPVVNPERARKFYEEKLGLQASEVPDGILYECGQGSRLALYQSDIPTQSTHTLASWEVDNIEEVVKTLGAKGVVFEQYDMPGLKTDDQGIAKLTVVKAAWFKDTEGNILSVAQFETAD